MAVTFTNTATNTSSSVASVVSATMDVGTLAGDRVIALAVGSEATGTAVPVSATVAGNATGATTLSTFGALASKIFYCGLPSGISTSTAVTVAVTFSGDITAGAQEIAVYRVTGASTTLSASGGVTDTDADPITTTALVVPTGGGGLAICADATDTTARTWAGFTESLDADAGGFRFSTGTSVTSSTAVTVTVSGGNNEDAVLSYAIFAAGGPLSPAVGNADGTSTADAVGESAANFEAVGDAAGTSTVSGIGVSSVVAIASAAGTSTADAVGSSQAGATEADAAAAGTSTADAVGVSTITADAASAGTSTVVAVGVSAASGDASSAGTSTVDAVGVSAANGVGNAAGTSTADAVGDFTGPQTIEGEGLAQGTSTADAVGVSSVTAEGLAEGTSTADAVGVEDTGEVVPTPNPFQGGGTIIRGTNVSRKKLLELYEVWREAKKKVAELKPSKARRTLAKAVETAKEVLEQVEDTQVDVAAVTALTNALEAAAGASKLSRIVTEARTAIAEAQAIQAQIEDEEAYFILAA